MLDLLKNIYEYKDLRIEVSDDPTNNADSEDNKLYIRNTTEQIKQFDFKKL